MPELISKKTVTARMPHRCMCCGVEAIQSGQVYRRKTYTHDGRIYNWVSCPDCAALSGDVFEWSSQSEEGIGEDTYCEWANECRAFDARAEAYLRRRLDLIDGAS